jgi:amino acid adenylation domain-containing protein
MSEALERRIAALSPERVQELLNRLAKSGGAARAQTETMPREPGRRYPLSSAQERMWFLCQLAPQSRVFNNPGAMRCWLSEPFDRERLEWSLNEVGRRHEILRTTFHSDAGRPVQVVHDELPLTVPCVDLRRLPKDEREREARRIAYEEGRQAFALETGPLIALKLVRLDDLEYLLLQTTHHIVSDGWSNAMFSKELPAIYEAGPDPSAPPLPPVPLQYLDYVHWEQEWLQGEQFREQLAYWKRQLPPQPPLELPRDRPRPAAMRHTGAMETLTLPDELTAALRAFARQERVSLFQTLMTGLMALLHRYTGEDAITVGTSSANRNRREFQGVMGPFLNTLAIRAGVDGERSFRAFVHDVRSVCQEALAHQELPFEKLIGELNPERQLNAHPIFQVLFVHQNVPSLYEVADMRLEVLKIDYEISKLDLNLWAEEIDDELRLALHYARELFEPATARRILTHFQGLLESALRDPQQPIGRLDYFSPNPAAAAVASNDEPVPLPRRFEEAARRFPDASAVEASDASLTYSELNAAANRLARHLRGRGAGPETIVGLLAARTAQSLVAVLGIMKAGAAYLPLDRGHPPARHDLLLEDSGARLVVTAGARDAAAGLSGVKLVDLDADADAIALEDDADLDEEVLPEQLAYVIYTSGTTGRPKGVLVEHRNLASYSEAVWEAMGLEPGNRFATVSSLAADLGNTMLFPPLANGGCVVVISEDMAVDAAALAGRLGRRPVDCLKIVPSHLRALLESPRAAALLPRRLLVLGGEACSSDLVRRVRATGTGCRVLNHYGPTEATVGVLTYEVPEGELEGDAIPLGHPLADSSVYVLDAARQPVPRGIAGEIYVGGRGVARGYLNRPQLDAQRFVASPFVPGERLYRTGDRGKQLDGGAIAFLGRVDRQVKVGGFRVEPGEIERALATHPEVVQAVVVAAPAPEGRRLVAYVRRAPGSDVGADTLRRHLATWLPPHMVPGTLTFVGAFALTANGKLDYDALPRADEARPAAEQHAPPRDWLELELAHIWEDILGVTGIGIDGGFFELGGHSLLAAQLMARIDARLDRQLPLAALFEHGTVRQLAALVRADAPVASPGPLVAVAPRGAGAPLVFVHPAGGNVLCYQPLAQALGSDAPFFGLQATTSAGAAAPGSIGDLARAYAAALPDDVLARSPLLGGWSMGALVAFEMACLLSRERDLEPAVAVLDQLAPDAVVGVAPDDDLSRLESFATKVSELVGGELGVSRAELDGQSADEQAAVLLERFKVHQLAPESTTVGDFRGFLDLMLAHNRMTGEYVPETYAGRIVVFRAGPDDDARPADLGWQRWSSQPVEVVRVPGSHVSMMRRPDVETLAQRLASWIAGAQAFEPIDTRRR